MSVDAAVNALKVLESRGRLGRVEGRLGSARLWLKPPDGPRDLVPPAGRRPKSADVLQNLESPAVFRGSRCARPVPNSQLPLSHHILWLLAPSHLSSQFPERVGSEDFVHFASPSFSFTRVLPRRSRRLLDKAALFNCKALLPSCAKRFTVYKAYLPLLIRLTSGL